MKLPPKPEAALDTECYRNFWLAKVKRVDTGAVRSFRMRPGKPLDRRGLWNTLKGCTTITFNGRKYDWAMIGYALAGADNAQLKHLSDELILTGLNPWDAERLYEFKIPEVDSIDLIEVMPGINSLKTYGGKLHCRKLQDLPYEPDEDLSDEQCDRVDAYCDNDLDITITAYRKFKKQIELREKMSREYNVDLRSKSDAQIAEAVLKAKISQMIGWRIGKPEVNIKSFKYKPPAWMQFSTPEMQQVFADVCGSTFYVQPNGKVDLPEALNNRLVTIGRSTYKMGIGGLHSTEANTAQHSDDEYTLYDRDVASYYPAIVIETQLFPNHLGRHFLHVYRDIRDMRIKAKKAGEKTIAETLKIVLNGAFGKFGNPYSTLYSPDLLMQVTITGQLALLMMIEALEQHDHIHVVSANTDGIVIKCRKDARDYMLTVIEWWEKATNFETEEVQYKALFSSSVNSYIALKAEGGVKLKGDFAPPEPVASSWPSPTNQVCVDAVCSYLEHGFPIETYIRTCTDPKMFVSVRKVTGGATWRGEYIGKTVRWIYAHGGEAMFSRKGHHKTGTKGKVAETDGCRPLMELPDELPADIDYGRYVEEAKKILINIGHTPPPPKVRVGRKVFAWA